MARFKGKPGELYVDGPGRRFVFIDSRHRNYNLGGGVLGAVVGELVDKARFKPYDDNLSLDELLAADKNNFAIPFKGARIELEHDILNAMTVRLVPQGGTAVAFTMHKRLASELMALVKSIDSGQKT